MVSQTEFNFDLSRSDCSVKCIQLQHQCAGRSCHHYMTLIKTFLLLHAWLWVEGTGGLGVLEGGGVSQSYRRYCQDDLMRLGMKVFHPQPCSLSAARTGKIIYSPPKYLFFGVYFKGL